MTTIRQLVNRNRREKKIRKSRVPALEKNPFKIGTVRKVFIEKPKKPNSARRKVVRVELRNKRFITCHIPGIGHRLSKFSVVMVRGGRTQDLIGVRYKAVRGKFDLEGVVGRKTRKTKFGIKNI
jgi:small subunit ribosomal protein S12